MGDQPEKRKRISCALDIEDPCNLLSALHIACGDGFHFILTNIVHPFHSRDLTGKIIPKVIGRTDRVLQSFDWSKLIVGKFSKIFQVDSEIEYLRHQDKKLLLQELGFASHLVLPAVLLKLTQRDNRNLAHILYNKLHEGACYQVWVQLPMINPKNISPFTKDDDHEDMWEYWNDFRRIANYHKKMGLALELPKANQIVTDLQIQRWCGEPIKALIIPTSLFILNQYNQPVLSKSYQEIIKKFMTLDVQYIITGPRFNFTYQQYCNYLYYLGKKMYDGSILAEFSMGCEDFLQNPLQPLSEHLETPVYEIFEKDPIKYQEYQNAIQDALEGIRKTLDTVVVMVVGAGRGPLVQATLNAAYLTHRKVRIYAVEKNPYAINTLEERIQNEWKGFVTLIHEDMRACKPPEDADILVSELLGSFGDNELSPECLDGAQRFLKRDGISIPQSYTSFLAPLQSTKLFNEIFNTRTADKTLQSVYETPYVVHCVNAYQIAEAQPLFTFKHPNWSENIVNERMGTLKFKAEQNCLLTGFAGYFETVLYNDVILSTNPKTHSPNMVSWFPILFPLPEPIQVKGGDTIEITFWRAENEEKVWYEWCLNSPIRGHINNINGRSYFIKKF